MSVQKGFLALLTLGPAYGSQLQSEFLARAAQREQVNAGQVYATLDRLIQRGLVRTAGETEDGLPLYALTELGHESAREWLGSGPQGAPANWDDLQDQVLIAASIADADPISVVRDHRAALARVLDELERADDATESPVHPAKARARRATELAARAAIQWLDEVSRDLELDRSLYVRPISSDRPRRGRRPKR